MEGLSMASRLALSPLLLIVAFVSVTPALAAAPRTDKPSITITSPRDGATVHGGTVTMDVAVSNFKLVPPIYLNPPMLKGNQGHIHYVLDSLAQFVAKRDAKAALSHSWTNVSPGPHTLIAYLATSQHALFPGTQRAQVHVLVATAPAGGAAAHAVVKHAAVQPMRRLPVTGGGGAVTSSAFELPAALSGMFCLLIGLCLLLWSRLRLQPEDVNF
jgi:hypothetical protein